MRILPIDCRRDLGERLAGTLKILELTGDVVGARLERLVLLHRDLIDRTEVVDLANKVVELALGGGTVIGRGERATPPPRPWCHRR